MAPPATPQDPDFAARVRSSFAQQGLMTTIGASLELVEPGEVHIGLPFSAALSQQHGYLHAGVTTAIADSANVMPRSRSRRLVPRSSRSSSRSTSWHPRGRRGFSHADGFCVREGG